MAAEADAGRDTEDAVLEGRGLVKRYRSGDRPVEALRGVDVAVDPGEFVAITGPSGSGKSTLLHLLGLLDVPTGGSVLLDGEDATTLSTRERTRARKRTLGFVFQDFYLVPTLTARENVAVPRLLDRDAETRKRAAALLERVGLGDRLDHTPAQLSGGQKQRVAFARALVNDPDVLLADEPTGNLGREIGGTVLEEFERVTDRGVAVVAVTHDPQVAAVADRAVEIVDGRLRR